MADILIVDDDESVVSAFKAFLAHEGHRCRVASNAEDAVAAVAAVRPSLVITDVRMPGASGIEGLERMREIAPGLPVVVMSAYGTSQTSIEAMRLGAFDYLTKPLDLDELRHVIAKAMAGQRVTTAAETDWDRFTSVTLVGQSERMVEVYKLIGVLAANEVAALIVGEPGTGKELIARTIHANSARKGEPFIGLDCSSLPESLLEGELTNALKMAARGSLYLCGLGALPPALQVGLTRDLRLGTAAGATDRPRVLAGDEQDLSEAVRTGGLSRDLYDFLAVIVLNVPPLRERRGDIEALVEHFIRRFNENSGRSIRGVDPAALKVLMAFDWPGNVAELELAVRRAYILARGDVITQDDLHLGLAGGHQPAWRQAESALEAAVRAALRRRLADETGEDGSPFHDVVGRVEEMLVREALAMTGGNQLRASQMLGVNRATLRKKMQPES